MSRDEMINAMVDSNNASGGAIQQNIVATLGYFMGDESLTDADFYHENGVEITNYENYDDKNGDGMATPDEITLGWSRADRNDAPQVRFSRKLELESVNEDGTWNLVTVNNGEHDLDLNYECGLQVNFEKEPEGMTEIVIETYGDPGTPSTPNNPSTLNNPSMPNNPSTPDQPVVPNNPDQPIIPNIPDQPVVPEPETQPTPAPEEVVPPKSYENMERVDNQILDDIAQDIGTEQVVVHQESAGGVTAQQPITGETAATIVDSPVANPAVEQAVSAEPQTSAVSNAGENLGGANADQYAPVQENYEAQAEMDANAMSVNEAITVTPDATPEEIASAVDAYLDGVF